MNNSSVERVVFRLKDLLTFISNKETNIRIFYNDNEIDYNLMGMYKDYYVLDIGIGSTDEGNSCIDICIDTKIVLVYMPSNNS